MDVSLLIPKLLLVYMVPGLLPTFIILSANINKLRSMEPGIVVTIFFALDIFISILLENIRIGFFQKFSINERKFFSKSLRKFFSLAKNDEVFPLKESWEKYKKKEQAAKKFWIVSNIEESGVLDEIPKSFDIYKKALEQLRSDDCSSDACLQRKGEELKMERELKGELKREYLMPTLTVGDRWVISNLLQKETKSFIRDEYFLFYQSSHNTMLSCLFAFILNYIRPFLNYGVWCESKTWWLLFKKCVCRPPGWIAISILILLVSYCVLQCISLNKEKDEDKKERIKDHNLRITIFCIIVALSIFFFPIVWAFRDNGTFWLTGIIGFVLMLFSIRFANMWGLATSRLSRKFILYSHINVKK